MMMESDAKFAWVPSESGKRESNFGKFIDGVGLPGLDELVARADADPGWFWSSIIQRFDLRFFHSYHTILDFSRGLPWHRWCLGGTTNIVLSCLDRQLAAGAGEDPAIVWHGEDGHVQRWNLRQLSDEVGKLSNALTRLGVRKGDSVGVLMPALPEVSAAFFAIAKLGATVVPLFSGLGTDALAARLNDVGAKALFTVDVTRRRGNLISLKRVVDELEAVVPTLAHVIVLRGSGSPAPLKPGRDHWWHEITASESVSARTIEVDAEHPLMVVYTSGTSGKPKGTVHTHIGFLAKTAFDHGLMLDFRHGDRAMWLSDPGWLGGPSRIVATTLLGVCNILVEGVPDFPQTDRLWRLIERENVSIFGITPTLMRSMMRHGESSLPAAGASSLRIVVSAGEPWDVESWKWTFKHLCRETIPILNGSGGTEIGGCIVGSTLLTPLKPTALGGGLPGMGADIVDETGQSVPAGVMGELVMRVPSIGLTRGLYNDPEKYLSTYWSRFDGLWAHGDLALRDADGLWYLHGRSDDTIKVAGKRLGPAEVEGLLMSTGKVLDSAVVGLPDPVKGAAVAVVCVLSPGVVANQSLIDHLESVVVRGVGSSFRPRNFFFVSDLPRTKTMKIMRRVVQAILTNSSLGDLSSLANPAAIEELKRSANISS